MGEVYILRLSDLRDQEEYLLDSADCQRKEKALRFIRKDDYLRSLAAGYLMKKYLPGFSEDRLRTGKDGKPFLAGGPAFSISHAGDYVVLAWDGNADGIGVDVEPIREMEYYQPILPFYTTTEEQKAIGNDAQKAVWIWTRKESLYKCVGEGISDFRELPDVLEDQALFSGILCCLRSWKKSGHMFSIAWRGLDKSRKFHVKPVEIR